MERPSAELLGERAQRFGLDDPERRDLWREREESDRETVMLLDEARLTDDQLPVDVHGLVHRSPAKVRQGAVRDKDADDSASTLAHAVGKVRAGEQTVADRVERALAAAARHRDLNAFTHVFEDEARAQAEELDARRARGEQLGPLAGVTVAVKDLIDVRGYATTAGTRAFDVGTAARDAEAVARLRAAGAVIIGMANLHALAYGALSTSSDAGPVRNPRRPGGLAGGSSGGSAAAVAAGITDLALGTDTAGSIRIPAALCGVVGFKPTYGRVPARGVHPLGATLDHVGPLTSTVADAALSMETLSAVALPAEASDWADLEGVTVGVPRSYFSDHLDPEVRKAFESATSAVREAGGVVQDVDIPTMRLVQGAVFCTLSAEAFDVHRELLQERGDQLPDDVRLRLEVGMFRSGADYVRAQRLRGALRAEVDDALASVHLLLTPTLPIVTPDIEAKRVDVEGARWTTQSAVTRLTMPFNATGHPALTVPWALDTAGGGIGIQLVGRAMDDATVLGAGRALEGVRGLLRTHQDH